MRASIPIFIGSGPLPYLPVAGRFIESLSVYWKAFYLG